MNQKGVRKLSAWELSIRDACLNLLNMFLVLGQSALFAAVWFAFYQEAIMYPYYYWGNWVVVGLFTVAYALFAHIYGGFQIKLSRRIELFYSLFIGSIFTELAIFSVICLLSYRLANPLPLLASWACGLLLSFLWTLAVVWINDRLFPPKRTYIIYDNEDAYEAMAELKKLKWKFDVIGSVHLSQGMDAIYSAVQSSEAVLLCGLSSSDRNTVLKYCIESDVQAYIRPKIGDILISGSRRIHLMNMPVLHCARSHASFWYKLISRTMDIVFSGLALLILSPIMLITALAIRLYDGGPALYRQTRLTENGREFKILKFRSMRTDAEKDGVARLAEEHDDRITPVGRIIRKFRLDELPQLINILKGEMAIVGPRPERPEIAAQYEREIPEFRLRLQVKAGLTGYAQVYGKYNTQPYDKLEMDLIYIASRSILQDIWLMFATVKILFMSESTEGIAEGKITAGKENIPA